MDPADSAVVAAETALGTHFSAGPDRAWALYELAKAHQIRYQTSHSSQDLESARGLYMKAIVEETDQAKKARYLNNLGLIYQSRYREGGNPTDLDDFAEHTREATRYAPDELRPAIMKSYADALQDRYYHYGGDEVLNECITIYQEALSLPEASSVRSKLCSNLCGALVTRSQVTADPADIDEACRLGQDAVSSTGDEQPMKALFIDSYANALYARYMNTNSTPDLHESIRHSEDAIELAEAQGLLELPNFYMNLGESLISRFLISRENTTDLDDAISLFYMAEDSISSSHPSYGKLLLNKGIALRLRFEQTGSEEDLSQSATACLEAVGADLLENNLRAQSEDALGNALLRQHELTGSPDFLDESILMYKQGLERVTSPSIGSGIWHNLGSALQTRYELRGSTEDLDDALIAIERGLTPTAKNLPDYASSLIGLGNVLVRKFETFNVPELLDQAISTYTEAMDLTGENDRTRAGRLTCLGHALQIRFELTGSINDIEDAIKFCKESVKISSKEPTYFLCLVNLGNCYLRRVLREPSSENLGLLNKSIRFLQTAANEMPRDFATRAMCLNDLGKAYELRFEETGSFDDYYEATRNYQVAMNLNSAPPMLRVMAGYRGAVLAWQKDLPKAVTFVEKTTKLLSRISPRILNRADQQKNVATFSGLASNGTAIILQFNGDALEALQTLELSRGVMNSLLLESRIDTSDVERFDPELAEEFKSLRDQLDSPFTGLPRASDVSISIKLETERRVVISKRFDTVLDRIRSNEKIGKVLLGPSKEDLQSLSALGPIVTINVSEIRSDALIVMGDRVWHLPLPNLRQAEVLQNAQKYLDTLANDTPLLRKKSNKTLHGIFRWLWDVAIDDILSELNIVSHEQENWPRIWWIPVGIMSIFPIHAAGEHSATANNNVLDRVISSYATTFKSLAYSRRISCEPIPAVANKLVFVAMSATPNQDDLAFANTEVSELVSKVAGNNITMSVFNSPAYKYDILLALQECSMVHFSCHGIVDLSDPSKSSLLLSDWETNPLTVSDIIGLKLKNAQLAYLSACHASSNRALDLLDEGIHLTGAFQMAGFPRTIGTLWQVDDERSMQVSKQMWDSMLGDAGFDKTAECLHHAVRSLKEQTRWVDGIEMQFPDQPIVWAPFIYMGI